MNRPLYEVRKQPTAGNSLIPIKSKHIINNPNYVDRICKASLRGWGCSMLTYDVFARELFVILNAVKDLLFAILLRPVQSANRSFVPQDDKPFKTSFAFVYPRILLAFCI